MLLSRLFVLRKALLPVETASLDERCNDKERIRDNDNSKVMDMGHVIHETNEDTSECSDYIDGTTIATCKNADNIIQHAKKMQEFSDKIYGKTLSNILAAQKKDKSYYDKKHASSKVIEMW